MSPRPLSSRPLLAAGTALVLALATTGCGSSDDEGTTSTSAGGATTTATTSTDGGSQGGGTAQGGGTVGRAPAADEGAIRAALARGPQSSKAAKTARIELQTSTAGVETKATGTIDLVDQRYLFTQTLGGGSGGSSAAKFQNYGEKDKVYVRLPGVDGWSVTDNPFQATDPLAQVRQLEQADITEVGDTKTYGGATCREFSAEIGIADVLGQIEDPSFQRLLRDIPKTAKVPVSACIDDAGLAYASESSYDLKDVLGEEASRLPTGRSTSSLRISDYGSAPEPQRPSGIDDARPLDSGSGATAPSAG